MDERVRRGLQLLAEREPRYPDDSPGPRPMLEMNLPPLRRWRWFELEAVLPDVGLQPGDLFDLWWASVSTVDRQER